MDRLRQDVRFAIRLLWKDRAFSTTTLATLALCVAANTAIFAIVYSVVLRPLPFPEAERLVIMGNEYPGAGVLRGSNGVPDYYDRLAQTTVFEELAMYRRPGVTIGGEGREAERVTAVAVTPSFFRLLRVQPFKGQLFTEKEAEPGFEEKVVLSHGLWQRLFAGQDDAIGQDLRINGIRYRIIGVTAPDFQFLDPDVQLWIPVAFRPADRSDNARHSNNWQQIGRLKPGATIEQAQSQIDAINAANFERFPQMQEILRNAGFRTSVRGFQAALIEGTDRTLYLLWGGVLLVMMIGCVNVANLVSVRATSRARELATRHALGASLTRLSRQILTETTILAAAGGASGIVLGWWALRASGPLGLDRLPRGHEIALDGTSVAVTVALVLVVGLLVGLVPVIALRRANLAVVVREESRSGTASRGTRLMRRALVTSQVAFALILLVGAGLLLASFERVLAVDPGFAADHVLTGNMTFPRARYRDAPAVQSVLDRMLERIRSTPGVVAAGVTSTLPLGGSYSDSVILAEGYQMAPGESLISPHRIVISPGYFEAMGITLLRGRAFDERDVRNAVPVIIVDDHLARKFWPNQDPIGKHMFFPGSAQNLTAPPPKEQWMTVVGVAEHVRLAGLVEPAADARVGAYYLPVAQQFQGNFAVTVRTAQSPLGLTNAIRAEIAAVDAEMPFYGVRTMDERVEQSLVDRRTPMLLALGFAGVALFLAAIGLYGVLAYQVSQRRREIGIRLALGAETASIFRMILGEGALMVLGGAAFGLIGALLLRRTLETQLYEITATDPRVMAIVGGILLAVALAACLLPARRAALTDPVNALSDR